MFRIFGKKKQEGPAPTLDQATQGISSRIESLDAKIKELDDELIKYKKQLANMKPGTAKESVKRRALMVLKQKRAYEKNRDVAFTQRFNIEQTKFAQDNLKDTMATVSAMKAAGKELKKQYEEVNLDEIEDVFDDMEDMMAVQDELQEIMGRTYGVPEELDETDLMNELAGLEDEIELNEETEEASLPSYLVKASNAVASRLDSNATTVASPTTTVQTAAAVPAAPAPPSRVPQQKQEQTDEFGLPVVSRVQM